MNLKYLVIAHREPSLDKMVLSHFDANRLSVATARPNCNGINDLALEAFSGDFITSATNSFNESGTWSLLEFLMSSIVG